jgi:hypothetical protein
MDGAGIGWEFAVICENRDKFWQEVGGLRVENWGMIGMIRMIRMIRMIGMIGMIGWMAKTTG